MAGIPLLEETVFGNSLLTWVLALAVGVLAYLILRLALMLARSALIRITSRTHTLIDDAILDALNQTRQTILVVIALYLGSLLLALPPVLAMILRLVAIVAALIQVGLWGNRAIETWLIGYRTRNLGVNAGAIGTARVISFIVRLVFFSILLILALDNLPGIEVTTLIAGLGIGGIAVALAVQNILSDLLASVSIALDKPFVIGDFIVVDEMMGTVDQIGMKTTRLKSLSGEQLIFANNDLLNARIRNFKRMEERRILFRVGVTYETSPELLRTIPAILREAVEVNPQVRFDRAHFFGFGDFSLDFEVVYFVLSPEYNTYMDIQQAINFSLIDRFASAGIGFAYPTHTVHFGSGQVEPVRATAR